jgi:hypothetical protein
VHEVSPLARSANFVSDREVRAIRPHDHMSHARNRLSLGVRAHVPEVRVEDNHSSRLKHTDRIVVTRVDPIRNGCFSGALAASAEWAQVAAEGIKDLGRSIGPRLAYRYDMNAATPILNHVSRATRQDSVVLGTDPEQPAGCSRASLAIQYISESRRSGLSMQNPAEDEKGHD